MSSPAAQKCPQCGAALPANAPGGLCPGCLMALNLKTETVFTDDAPAAQPPLPPDEIAPHFPQLEILKFLGRGGMGVVYQVRQKSLNRLAALKLLAPERVHEAKFAERFAREAQALAALNHPNIVTIYDFGQAGGFYYLLMEFVDGVNLRELLRTQKCTPEEALAIVPPLCDALQYAHERGIVHRDIKPENLLLDKSGRVKVADFGIAKMMGTARGEADGGLAAADNVTKSALGTPGYSAPEQKSDPQRVDSRADIYSLGVVFYEMLTGELPGLQLQPPSKKVSIDVRLDEVVLRALEKQPERRYQQASEVKTCLETIAATQGKSRHSESGNCESGKGETGGGKPGEGKSQSLVTSAATNEMPVDGQPTALTVAGVLFVFLGVFSLCKISYAAWLGTHQSALGIYCLPIGIGLLRQRWWCRWGALICVWLGFTEMLILLILMFAKANGVALMDTFNGGIFGWQPSALQMTWMLMAGFLGQTALLLWMHRVLTRPGIKARFAAQRGWRTDRFEVLVTVGLMVFAFGAVPQWAWQARYSENSETQVFRQVEQAPFVARLNQGTVELLAIRNQNETNTPGWLPDGERSPNPFPQENGSSEARVKDHIIKQMVVRIHDERGFGTSCPVCRFNPESSLWGLGSAWGELYRRSPDHGLWQAFCCPTNAASMDVALGIANGPWETALTLAHDHNGGGSEEWVSPQNGEMRVTFDSAAGPGGTVAVNCTYSQYTNWESRMVGVGADGKITRIPQTSHLVDTSLLGGLLVLSSNDFAQIKEFQLQRRRYQWVEFRNVSLQSGHRTMVGVKDAGPGTEGHSASSPNQAPAEVAVSAAPAVSFGPVVERVINNASAGSNYVICFKTGEVRTPPQEIPGSLAEIYPWVQRERMDAAAGVITNSDALCGYDLAAIPVPAQCWEALSPTQAARRLDSEAGSRYKIMSFGQASSLPDTCLFRPRDGGIGLLQVTGITTNPPGLKVRYKFLAPAPVATPPAPSMAAAEWLPDLLPGEKPDLGKILEEAKKLTDTAHFEEALQRYLWFHNHAQEFGDLWQNAVRRLSALSDWVELGRRYPKARQALLEIRDEKTRKIATGQGYCELFQDVQAINRELQDEEATCALLKTLLKVDEQLAGQCYPYAEGLLMQQGDYALCLNFLGDPQARFEAIRSGLEMQQHMQEVQRASQERMEAMRKQNHLPEPMGFKRGVEPPDMGQRATNNFVGQIRTLVEILAGTGNQALAEKIQGEALAAVADARLKSAVSDAAANLQRRSRPAAVPATQ